MREHLCAAAKAGRTPRGAPTHVRKACELLCCTSHQAQAWLGLTSEEWTEKYSYTGGRFTIGFALAALTQEMPDETRALLLEFLAM